MFRQPESPIHWFPQLICHVILQLLCQFKRCSLITHAKNALVVRKVLVPQDQVSKLLPVDILIAIVEEQLYRVVAL